MGESAPFHGSAVRVGVADKNPLVQAELTHLLLVDPRFDLVNVYADGEENGMKRLKSLVSVVILTTVSGITVTMLTLS